MDFIFRLAEEFLKKHKRLNRYRRVFAVIAAVVVFATTYELILPAITMDKRRAADTPGVEVGVAADSFEEEAAENESGESVEEENAGEESEETPEAESADPADTDADSGNGSDGSGNAADTDAASGHSTAGNAGTDLETSEGHSEEAGQEDGSSDDANVKAEAADHADTADTGSSDRTDASADKNGQTTETTDNGSTSEAVDPASAAATMDPSLIAPGETITTYPATLVFEGKDYTITATFDETAGLPADVRLDAVEILPDVIYKDENGNPLYSTYEEYYEKAVKAVEKEKNLEEQGQTVTTARFFDITFLDAEGFIVEPEAPVSIAVKYKEALSAEQTADTMAVHFDVDEKKDETKVEVINTKTEVKKKEIEEISFEAEKFSVYGLIGTEVITGDDQTFNITQDGWTVTVHTPEGAFPAGTEMQIEKITDPETIVKIVSVLDSSKVYSIAAVDISFYYEGKEIEPLKPVDVTMKSDLLTEDQYQIVHLKDDEKAEVITDATTEIGQAEFTLDSFSAVGAAAVELDTVDKTGFQVYNGTTLTGNPESDLTPGVPSAVAPIIDGYVFVNATVNDSTTPAAAAQAGVVVTYIGSFVSNDVTYIYYKTATDTIDLVVHVEDNEFIQLNYLPEDNYYNISYSITGDTSETNLDEVFGAERTKRAIKQSSDIGYTVTIPRGYTATIYRNGDPVLVNSVATNAKRYTLGAEPEYSVSNNKVITKNGELELTGTFTIPRTDVDQNIEVRLTKRTSYTYDVRNVLQTVYFGGRSGYYGDTTVTPNNNNYNNVANRISGSGWVTHTISADSHEQTWTFTTQNRRNHEWLMDSLEINGTNIEIPYSNGTGNVNVSKTTVLPSGTVITVTLTNITGTQASDRKRTYTITATNCYEDVVLSGGNIYDSTETVEIIPEQLDNVSYSFYGFTTDDNHHDHPASNAGTYLNWHEWGVSEPISAGSAAYNTQGYNMYRLNANNVNPNSMRFSVEPGYINPQIAFVTSVEGNLGNYLSGLSLGNRDSENYYPVNSSPNSSGYYVFSITSMGSNKLALLRIRAELAKYGVTYDSNSVTTEAGTMPEDDYGDYNVVDKDTIVLASNIPVDRTGTNTFSYYWTIQNGNGTHYAPGEPINLADVVQYAIRDAQGRLVIPFVANWTPREQATQVNYRIEYWVDGKKADQDSIMKFFYSMLAPEGSAIYVNRSSDYINHFLEVYRGLLEYDEENSASYVANIQEGDIIRLHFKWVRHPLIVEKQVNSITAAEKTKDFEFSLNTARNINIPVYHEDTATIDPEERIDEEDDESFDNFTLKDTQTKEFTVMRESKINLSELEESAEGFAVSYKVTTYEEDGETPKEERIVTKEELSEIKVTEKMKVTVINDHGKVNVSKIVAVTGENISLTDINTTIYIALKRRGENEFVTKDGTIYTIPIVITNGVPSPATVTFTGISDGEYEVWELSDTNGTSLNVGDVIEMNGKMVQLAQIDGNSSEGVGNNIKVTNNNTAWARFTNTYSYAGETIFFRARKRWMDFEGNVGNQYAPNGGSVVFTIYKEVNEGGSTSTVEISSITLDGTVDENGEAESWIAKFENLPRVDDKGDPIVYKVRETSAPAGYVAYKAVGTTAEYEMGPDEYLTTNGGSIYNRRVGQPVKIKKVGSDTNGQGLSGAEFTLQTVNGTLTTGDDGYAGITNGNTVETVFVLPIRDEGYTLSETKAPDYYDIGVESITLTVADSGVTVPAGTQNPVVTGPDQEGVYTVTVTDPIKKATVTIIKEVEGTEQDENSSYSFTLTGLPDETLQLYGEEKAASATGPAQKKQEQYTEISYGTTISVTEDTYSEFDTTVSVNMTGSEQVTSEGSTTGDIVVNGDTTITFTNKRKGVSIYIKKVDEKHTFIADAKFKLFEVVTGSDGTSTDQIVGAEFTIGTENGFKIENLHSGNYKLTETHAPAGYIIVAEPLEFTVDATGTGNIISWKGQQRPVAADSDPTTTDKTADTITVKNTPGERLPTTGGAGKSLYTLGGIFIMMTAAMMYVFRMRRRERRLR